MEGAINYIIKKKFCHRQLGQFLSPATSNALEIKSFATIYMYILKIKCQLKCLQAWCMCFELPLVGHQQLVGRPLPRRPLSPSCFWKLWGGWGDGRGPSSRAQQGFCIKMNLSAPRKQVIG